MSEYFGSDAVAIPDVLGLSRQYRGLLVGLLFVYRSDDPVLNTDGRIVASRGWQVSELRFGLTAHFEVVHAAMRFADQMMLRFAAALEVGSEDDIQRCLDTVDIQPNGDLWPRRSVRELYGELCELTLASMRRGRL